VVAEAPKTGEAVIYICTAIRSVAVGDIAVPAEMYDVVALLAFMDEYAQGKLQWAPGFWLRWAYEIEAAEGADEFSDQYARAKIPALSMTTKAKPARSPAPAATTRVLKLQAQKGEDHPTALVRNVIRPEVRATYTVDAFTVNSDDQSLSLTGLMDQLAHQCDLVNQGSLDGVERMLMAQSQALDAIFHKLARRALHCDLLSQYETHMRLALKAQSNCRATLQALAEIKNPRPLAFVKQANFAGGNQQVNNAAAGSRAQKIEIPQSKLLEAYRGERLDIGAQSAPSAAHQALEALGGINGATDTAR
jgi:hypothetical protein